MDQGFIFVCAQNDFAVKKFDLSPPSVMESVDHILPTYEATTNVPELGRA